MEPTVDGTPQLVQGTGRHLVSGEGKRKSNSSWDGGEWAPRAKRKISRRHGTWFSKKKNIHELNASPNGGEKKEKTQAGGLHLKN